LATLYYGGVLRHDGQNPDDPNRDRLLISKGHAAAAVYPILADKGYFPRAELARYTQPGGLLGMYADLRIPGIEGISGSLGHGVGLGAGFALAGRMAGQDFKTVVIVGDGECYEGSIWESAIFAAHHRLDSLITVVDRNKLCILGETESLLELGDLAEKWAAFGWYTLTVDGHDPAALLAAFAQVGQTQGKPLAIIADTIKGKGISFMEGANQWHNRMPSPEQIEQARRELAHPA
jgi:transketolase